MSDPDLVRVLPQLASLLLLLGGGFAGILLLLATSILIFRTGVLPRWLAWFGIVVAIALVFDVTYMNIVPLLAWVVGASIVLLRRQDETATAAAPESRYAAANEPVTVATLGKQLRGAPFWRSPVSHGRDRAIRPRSSTKKEAVNVCHDRQHDGFHPAVHS